MSRPPYPRKTSATRSDLPAALDRLDYLPAEYADLLADQVQRASSLIGRASPEILSDDTVDVTTTFMEMSALVGHVLGVYQRHLARESFLSTASTRGSLLRHARRLAYDPDPGVAASGYAVLLTKPGVTGTVAAGLPLASVPFGDTKAQDYEVRDDVIVDADLNEVLPLEALRPVTIATSTDLINLKGVGHALAPGDPVALVGRPTTGTTGWAGTGLAVESVVEDPQRGLTAVRLTTAAGAALVVDPADPPVLLGRPGRVLQQLGSDADPAQYPPDAVRTAGGTEPSSYPKYWYEVQRADQGTATSGYRTSDVYLSEKVSTPLVGGYVLHRSAGSMRVLRVQGETVAAVTLHSEVEVTYTIHTVNLKEVDSGYTSEIQDAARKMPLASHISGTVTAITVDDSTGSTQQRSALQLPGEWLAQWALEAPLAAEEPNPDPLGDVLTLPGVHTALAPGRPLIFSDLEGSRAQVVVVRRAEADTEAGTTRVEWDPVTPVPAGGWTLDDLKIYGNVARVSHGRTVEETLGSSDGVTAFQEFPLRESPVTVLLGVSGGEPELEVRVDEVRWSRVPDLGRSGPEDRHYRTVTDENQVTTVVFGDGRYGAVPPAGRQNVRAVYRVGLGEVGDVEPRRLSRLKRAHPLLAGVQNLTPVSGGSAPADQDTIRSQATRWVRTFDRAVSADDLAALALTIPGVARAASRWDPRTGATVVVATATGAAPPDLATVRAFLDARRDTRVPMRLTGPRARAVRLTVSLEADPAYFIELVKDSVRRALHGDAEEQPGMFTFSARQLGQPAFRSEVYAALQALPGVVGVRLERFGTEDTQAVAEVITVEVDGWLRLSPNDLVVVESGR